MTTVNSDRKTTTTQKPGAPAPSAADAKAAAATAKAKAEEGAEDIGGLQSTATEKHLPQGEMNAVRKELRTIFFGTVTADDAIAVVDKLARLPRADFKSTLDDIANNPAKFEALIAALPETNREIFTDLMVQKGYVGVEPAAVESPRNPRAPVPPRAPTMLRDDAKLPDAVRQFVADTDGARAEEYRNDFDSYRTSYRSAVETSKSMSELRALGPLLPPATPEQLPGAEMQSKGNREYAERRGQNVDDFSTIELVANQARRLSGRPVAGVSFTAEAEVMVTLGKFGVGADAKVTHGPDKTDGMITPSAQLKAEGISVKGSKDGLTVSAEGSAGKFEGVINGEGSIAAEIIVSGEGGQENGGGFALDNNEGFKASVTHDGFTGSASFNGDSMAYGIGKEFKLDVGPGEVEAELSIEVGLQGVTKEDRDAFVSDSDVGFFDAPPELSRGKAWESLPAETRGHYENLGWTQKEWANAADLARATRRL